MHIAISYRDESHGKAAFFDHTTLRNLTGIHTQIAKSPEHEITTFASYINGRNGDPQKYGLPLDTEFPDVSFDYAKKAVCIFIPGYSRESDNSQSDNHVARIQFEKKLIAKAATRGQPVLAVCAGSWTLWQSFGGTLESVSDHNYGGAMPRLSTVSAKVVNNKMIHRITLQPSTKLAEIMGTQKRHPVNSVHWQAVDASSTPNNFYISARSRRDATIAPLSRQSTRMQPDACVEAFESNHGVPMFGAQWHPEAFNPGDDASAPHQAIFKYMVQAGKTYLNRQELNKEFNQRVGRNVQSFFHKPARIIKEVTERKERKEASIVVRK